MAVPPNKRREAPSEPLKRVLGPTVRAIAGDADIEVDFGPGKGEVTGKSVSFQNRRAPRLPKISRWRADGRIAWRCASVATTPRYIAASLRRLDPARAVFEAAERARVEGLGLGAHARHGLQSHGAS